MHSQNVIHLHLLFHSMVIMQYVINEIQFFFYYSFSISTLLFYYFDIFTTLYVKENNKLINCTKTIIISCIIKDCRATIYMYIFLFLLISIFQMQFFLIKFFYFYFICIYVIPYNNHFFFSGNFILILITTF